MVRRAGNGPGDPVMSSAHADIADDQSFFGIKPFSAVRVLQLHVFHAQRRSDIRVLRHIRPVVGVAVIAEFFFETLPLILPPSGRRFPEACFRKSHWICPASLSPSFLQLFLFFKQQTVRPPHPVTLHLDRVIRSFTLNPITVSSSPGMLIASLAGPPAPMVRT